MRGGRLFLLSFCAGIAIALYAKDGKSLLLFKAGIRPGIKLSHRLLPFRHSPGKAAHPLPLPAADNRHAIAIEGGKNLGKQLRQRKRIPAPGADAERILFPALAAVPSFLKLKIGRASRRAASVIKYFMGTSPKQFE